MNWLWVDHGGMDWSEYTHAYCYERRKTTTIPAPQTTSAHTAKATDAITPCPATGHSHNHSFIKIS
jgi:hypothetical protein